MVLRYLTYQSNSEEGERTKWLYVNMESNPGHLVQGRMHNLLSASSLVNYLDDFTKTEKLTSLIGTFTTSAYH